MSPVSAHDVVVRRLSVKASVGLSFFGKRVRTKSFTGAKKV
jgi:hypothetical protein